MTQLNELINESDCPVSFLVHMGKCPEESGWPKPIKRLKVGSTISLTVQWPAPDNWLARASEWLTTLLYGIGIRWQKPWGRWRMDSIEAKAEVIQDNEAGLHLQMRKRRRDDESEAGQY